MPLFRKATTGPRRFQQPVADDNAPARSTTRRGAILLGAQFLVAGALAWRMRQLQIVETEHYRLLAEENRINIRLIAPARAEIFDRNGVPLAVNRQNYRIVMVREQAGDPEEMLDRLARIIDIPDHEMRRILKEFRTKPAFVPVPIADFLDWESFAAVNANAPALPGVLPEVGLSRHYPHGPQTAHVVGYVGRVTERDLENPDDQDPILQVPEFQIGKDGIERAAERELRGSAGTRRIEVNAVGRVIREIDRVEGAGGKDLQLTLDLGLQRYCHERLGSESAAVVVMDATNGDLLALASNPTFEPNLFVQGISQSDYAALIQNDHRPLHNKWASGMYPPGSTFKMVVALAALEAGIMGPGDTVFCNGGYQLGNRRFHCWRRGGHGHVDMRESLEQSCDVYYYDVARRVGIDRIAAMANRLGLGVEHDLPLPSIKSGLIPTRDWKRAAKKQGWQAGDTLNTGIGQGFVLTTPLQLAIMTSRIATGRIIAPRLVRTRDGVPIPEQEAPPLGLSEAQLRVVRDGMHSVVNSRRGTAWRSRIVDDAALIAGKTGTSQVRNITAAERARGVFRNEDLPWARRDHALFTAYAPSDRPKYAIAVVVEHGGGGSAAAAPVARDILMHALYGPEPPLTAYPADQRPERPTAEPPADAPATGTSRMPT
ncbi:penicillin-binding protein 2 [Limibaculum sp. M0105]|uniref:Penicillin-binding protein 2 n=1 Tax=Thermohalobaculum xanthum TaxID=2753746 RepID=A0A8J7M492_9RHOB|nr:penicillin-binding protein 2 [Thermohalobaculum xanthum]MBK0397939.1 penicillin-binding protein 2 [Thermohalobaculum xanthum]